MRRGILTLLRQLTADDGGRRLREDGADDEGEYRWLAGQPEQHGDQGGGQQDLRGAQAKDLVAHRVQLRQRIGQPDGKEQEDHAKLGQHLEFRHMHRRPDGVRPEDQADQQIAEAGRDMQPLEDDHGRHGNGQQEDDLYEMIHQTIRLPVCCS